MDEPFSWMQDPAKRPARYEKKVAEEFSWPRTPPPPPRLLSTHRRTVPEARGGRADNYRAGWGGGQRTHGNVGSGHVHPGEFSEIAALEAPRRPMRSPIANLVTLE
jgi:hypothetical protein